MGGITGDLVKNITTTQKLTKISSLIEKHVMLLAERFEPNTFRFKENKITTRTFEEMMKHK